MMKGYLLFRAFIVALLFLVSWSVADVMADDTGLVSSDDVVSSDINAVSEGVAGLVADLQGHPVEGAFVQAAPEGESQSPVPELAVFSDNSGHYFWPLGQGSYRLTATAEGYKRASGSIVVRTGNRTTLDFRLEKAP